MWKWLQKTDPVPVTLHTQFVIAEKDYTLISSTTMVQVMRNSTHELLYTYEQLGHPDRTQHDAEKLYNTMHAVYMCDPPPEPDAQPTTPRDRMARIPYVFQVEYRTNTEDRDEERLEVYISLRAHIMHHYFPYGGVYAGFHVNLYFRDPSRRKYTPITLDAMGYSLSISRKEAAVPGWVFKSATYDINPKERAYVTTMYDMNHNEIGTLTTDTNIILDKIFFAERISELTASLIDNGQTLRIEVDIAYSDYQAVLLFARNPPNLTAASAQRLLEGIERVLNA
jgi:hypothetical protein